MRILVTGVGGFIGSAIVEGLVEAGHGVLACTRTANNLPCASGLEFVPVDLNRMLSAEDWLPGMGSIHCAGSDAPRQCHGKISGAN